MSEIIDFYSDEEELDMFDPEEVVPGIGFAEMTSTDAYVYSMSSKGFVDLEYMQSISGIDTDQLIEDLEGKAIDMIPLK